MNDNKSAVMNNAAVQQLRKVPGFAISGSGFVWPAQTGECS